MRRPIGLYNHATRIRHIYSKSRFVELSSGACAHNTRPVVSKITAWGLPIGSGAYALGLAEALTFSTYIPISVGLFRLRQTSAYGLVALLGLMQDERKVSRKYLKFIIVNIAKYSPNHAGYPAVAAAAAGTGLHTNY